MKLPVVLLLVVRDVSAIGLFELAIFAVDVPLDAILLELSVDEVFDMQDD
jgi:hypothetical protein